MNKNLKKLLPLIVFFASLGIIQAQIIEISGAVTDKNGVPIPGVNILIEGTSTGTSTDFDGNYSLSAESGQVLTFSSVGFQDVNIDVSSASTINVIMEEGTSLDEVVVTALGISREKRSLGYSTQEISSEDMPSIQNTNFINSLSGRVSGIHVRRNNNFGGSTNTIIRGNKSLTGDNQALYVIDGIPITNRNTNQSGQSEAQGTNYDYGNPASDIDPDNIESINVLKGAAATALYGSRAANGVILIKTKKGDREKGLGVSINSGFEVGFIDNSTWIDYQDQYGAGVSGEQFTYEDITGDGELDELANYLNVTPYGPRYDPNRMVYQWNSFDPESPNYLKKTPWVFAEHGPKSFFNHPVTLSNSIAISNGTENGSYRLSYTNKDQTGLLPNSHIRRNDFSFTGDFDVNDKLHVNGFANYIEAKTVGRNITGYNENIYGMFRQFWKTNVDVKELKELYELTGRNISMNPPTSEPGAGGFMQDNPYWTRYENYQNDGRRRFVGKIQLDYDVFDWLNIVGRISTDTYSEKQEERRAVGSGSQAFGITRNSVGSGYLRRDITSYETNYDLMLNFNKDIGEKLNFTGLLGSNIRRSEFDMNYQSTSGGLLVPGLYSLQNSVGPLPRPAETLEKIGVNGFYGSVSLGWDNQIFFDATLRRDKFSTLPKNHAAFYYPSASASWVFSQIMKNDDAVTFGKLRLNYAEVGNGAPFDRLFDSYLIADDVGTRLPDQSNNPDLKPERTKNFEAGLEMQFFDNRFGFDVDYYRANSVNQIVSTPISDATGYHEKLVNAGKIRNEGVELSLNVIPVKTKDFLWDLKVNYTKNKNKVVSLPEGISTIQLGTFQGGVTIQATEGRAFGEIRGDDYVYDDNGNKIVDPETGFYELTGSNNVIGNQNPDWLMGISNSFQYKGLTLSFLIDIQQGGDVFSLDHYYGENSGMYKNSVGTNDLGNPVRNPLDEGGGFINPGVLPDGSANDIRVDASERGAYGYMALPNSEFVYDASFVKLRDLSLTYTLPSKLFDNMFLNMVEVSLVGHNLWIIHKNIPDEDPESGLSSGSLQGYIVGPPPTTRQIGANIKVQF